MDTFVLGAQATEIRGELLKERQRRFDLEAKVRTLEQQLQQFSSHHRHGSMDATRSSATAEGSPLENSVLRSSTASNGTSQLLAPEKQYYHVSPSESGSIQGTSPRIDLEAERDWINSVHVPSGHSKSSHGASQTQSTGGSELSSLAGDDGEVDRNQSEVDDFDFGLGPSLAQYGGKSRYPARDVFSSGSITLSSSPTPNGGGFPSDPKVSVSGSGWSSQETTRRRYDEAALRVSQLKIEVAEYKHVLSETSTQLSQSKSRSEFLLSQLIESQTSLDMLRDQVREKNRRILQLTEQNRSVESLKEALNASNAEKISLQVELSTLQRAHQSTLESEASLKQRLEKLEGLLKSKDSEAAEKDSTMAVMAEKLMSMKMQLQAIVPHLCKFSVSTVVRFGKSVVVSIGILKPNAERQRELEIVTAGKRVTHPASFVVSIASSATHKDRFMVTYRNGNTDLFDSNRRAEVVQSLNDLLFGTADAEESSSNS
jgi:hypothetical protein